MSVQIPARGSTPAGQRYRCCHDDPRVVLSSSVANARDEESAAAMAEWLQEVGSASAPKPGLAPDASAAAQGAVGGLNWGDSEGPALDSSKFAGAFATQLGGAAPAGNAAANGRGDGTYPQGDKALAGILRSALHLLESHPEDSAGHPRADASRQQQQRGASAKGSESARAGSARGKAIVALQQQKVLTSRDGSSRHRGHASNGLGAAAGARAGETGRPLTWRDSAPNASFGGRGGGYCPSSTPGAMASVHSSLPSYASRLSRLSGEAEARRAREEEIYTNSTQMISAYQRGGRDESGGRGGGGGGGDSGSIGGYSCGYGEGDLVGSDSSAAAAASGAAARHTAATRIAAVMQRHSNDRLYRGVPIATAGRRNITSPSRGGRGGSLSEQGGVAGGSACGSGLGGGGGGGASGGTRVSEGLVTGSQASRLAGRRASLFLMAVREAVAQAAKPPPGSDESFANIHKKDTDLNEVDPGPSDRYFTRAAALWPTSLRDALEDEGRAPTGASFERVPRVLVSRVRNNMVAWSPAASSPRRVRRTSLDAAFLPLLPGDATTAARAIAALDELGHASLAGAGTAAGAGEWGDGGNVDGESGYNAGEAARAGFEGRAGQRYYESDDLALGTGDVASSSSSHAAPLDASALLNGGREAWPGWGVSQAHEPYGPLPAGEFAQPAGSGDVYVDGDADAGASAYADAAAALEAAGARESEDRGPTSEAAAATSPLMAAWADAAGMYEAPPAIVPIGPAGPRRSSLAAASAATSSSASAERKSPDLRASAPRTPLPSTAVAGAVGHRLDARAQLHSTPIRPAKRKTVDDLFFELHASAMQMLSPRALAAVRQALASEPMPQG